MKLNSCLKIAYACGLNTIGEAYNNVTLHYSSFFIIEKANEEIQELVDEIEEKNIKFSELIIDHLSIEDRKQIDSEMTPNY